MCLWLRYEICDQGEVENLPSFHYCSYLYFLSIRTTELELFTHTRNSFINSQECAISTLYSFCLIGNLQPDLGVCVIHFIEKSCNSTQLLHKFSKSRLLIFKFGFKTFCLKSFWFIIYICNGFLALEE